MDLEKFRQYANSKIKTDKMRADIKETLDEYKTTQRMGYEAAKTQFKPLLDAQAKQTAAQEAQAAVQTAMMKQIVPLQKSEEFPKTVQEFIKKYGFPLPSLLLSQGIWAYKNGEEDVWKDKLLDLSLEITRLIEITDDPTIKKAAGEYKKYLKKVVTTVVTPQKQQKPPGFTTPKEALSPATSTEQLVEIKEVDPRQAAAEKVFDYPLEVLTVTYLESKKLDVPSKIYLDGLNAEKAGQDKYSQWRTEINLLLRDLSMTEEAAIGNEKHALNDYITQLKKIVNKMPPIPAIEADLNKSFTEEELKYLKNYKLKSPQEVFDSGVAAKKQSPTAYEAWKTNIETKAQQLKKQNQRKNVTNKPLRKRYYIKLEQILVSLDDSKVVAGKGRNQKKFTIGSGVFMNPQDLFKKLELITGSIIAGNTSKKIRNDAYKIIDKLLEIGLITKTIYNKYIKEYLKH